MNPLNLGGGDHVGWAVPPRALVRAFAAEMEMALRANDHKGGWDNEVPGWLLNRAREELQELEDVVDAVRAKGVSPELAASVRAEAADVANFVMFVADVTTRPREE